MDCSCGRMDGSKRQPVVLLVAPTLCTSDLINGASPVVVALVAIVAVQVAELKADLSQAKVQQDKLRAEVAAAAAARDAASERVMGLKQEVEQLQFMLDEVHAARSDSPAGKVSVLANMYSKHVSKWHTSSKRQPSKGTSCVCVWGGG